MDQIDSNNDDLGSSSDEGNNATSLPDVAGTFIRDIRRLSVEGANPNLSQEPARLARQSARNSEQDSGNVGVFLDVPDEEKPEESTITGRLRNCVVTRLPENWVEDMKEMYGPTIHAQAVGNLDGDRYRRFRDGLPITTSLLVRDVTHKDGSRFLYTLNSIYEVVS